MPSRRLQIQSAVSLMFSGRFGLSADVYRWKKRHGYGGYVDDFSASGWVIRARTNVGHTLGQREVRYAKKR